MKKSIISFLLIVSIFSTLSVLAEHHEDTMMDSTSTEAGVMVGWAAMVPSKNIVQNAVNSSDHTTLVAAVWAANLATVLQTEGPFTVFAPTNSAFEKLPAGTVETLLEPENIDNLTGILTYHVVAGAYTSDDLEDGMELITLQGETIEFSYTDGKWFVNNALIEIADILSSNWVTYVVDTVLMPELSYEARVKQALEIRSMLESKDEAKVDNVVSKYNEITADFSKDKKDSIDTKFISLIDEAIAQATSKGTLGERSVRILALLKLEIINDNSAGVMVGWAAMVPSKNIVQNAVNSSDHTTLVAAVWAADLASALQAEGPFTVFAPTNSAFEKLPAGTVETLLEPENIDDLTGVLTYHVVAGTYLASDLKDGLTVATLQGDTLTFTIEDEIVHINGEAMVETLNIVSTNGVTHVIDTVLIPSE